MRQPTIVIFGAGAVGGAVGGWLAPYCPSLYLIDKPPVVAVLKERGITHYLGDTPGERETVPVQAAASITEVPPPDIVVIAVKNFSLDAVARTVRSAVGDPLVVALQNGVENQKILPKYFSKVIYGIVSFNAWLDEPGVVGYQKRGPLIFGALPEHPVAELAQVAALFNQGVPSVVTPHLVDAAYSKMVINLTNSFTTLVGHKFREISDPALFQKLLTNLTFEGVQILKAAGRKECRLGGMPSWLTITAAAKLPPALTRRTFNKNVKKMVMSSMAQDILQRGSSDSELESLNGCLLKIADEHHLRVPYNRAIYKLCKERFGKPGFRPLDVTEVWDQVQAQLT